MNQNIEPTAVMCFSDGAGGMDMSALKLASILSTVSRVVFVCKQSSFAERLYHKRNFSFQCEKVKFFSRIFSPSMLIRVRSILNHYQIRNVIFLGASELKTLSFTFLGKDLNVIVWHGTTKSSPKRDILHRLVYSCVNHHVAISSHLIQNVKTIVPITPNVDFRMIRPSLEPVPVNAMARKTDGRDTIKISHVGRIAAGKGQIDAVLACRGLFDRRIDFRLCIIGEDNGNDYARKLKNTIESTPYKDRILLTGFQNDVHRFLEGTDIFLFPSAGEGMPWAFIEALHHKVVCIAYDNTVFPEFSDLGFYIHLVENQSIGALTEKLLHVAVNLDEEVVKSEPNIELAREIFTVERELSEWREILV